VAEVRAPLEAMYRAGKLDIPAEADLVSTISDRLYDALHSFDGQSALAGDPKVMTSMLRIGGEVYEVMRDTLRSLDHCAAAIIATADDFVAHDQQAADDYSHLGQGLKTADVPTHTLPPPLPDLAAPGGPDPVQPTYIGMGDFVPHPEQTIPSTPDPDTPQHDHDDRDQTEQDDHDHNPVVPPEIGLR